ncbi:hypothetical protein [Dactylosporangium sp. CA-233914]|uniref:hypothetical protein n=1 Tax=Dactylosporangium sp. CA-233914 TaxID=3239934 RepID=UPI003D8BADC8
MERKCFNGVRGGHEQDSRSEMGWLMWTWDELSASPEVDRLAVVTARVGDLAAAANLDMAGRTVLTDAGFVDRLRSRIGATATLTVIGQVSVGKSSFVNSLFGRHLLALRS